MKLFFIKLISLTFCMLIIILFSIFFIPNISIHDSLYYAYNDKHKFLESTESPRIIFIGGSNLSFGLSSVEIADTLNKAVINMGLHAGLGLRFICEDVKSEVREDDILVISPEYAHFLKGRENIFWGSDELLYIIFDVAPEKRKIISFNQWLHIIKFIPKYASKKLFYFPRSIFNSSKNDKQSNNDVYRRDSFNKNGDVIAHYNKADRSFTEEDYSKHKINYETFDYLRNYIHEMNNRKVKVFFLFPAYKNSAYEKNQGKIDIINNLIMKDFDVDFLSTMQKSILDDSLFFNTEYHLNKEGVKIRTDQLIFEMKQFKSTFAN